MTYVKREKRKKEEERGIICKRNNLQEEERNIEMAKGISGCGMMKNGPRVATR